MVQVQIALPIVRDFTSLDQYGEEEERADQEARRSWGMIFTWASQRTSSRRLVCLGLDICGTRRWEQMLSRTPAVVERVFTGAEICWAARQSGRLARLWAIKEAFAKALGCGFAGIGYQDIALEFASRFPTIRFLGTVPVNGAAEDGISEAHWQLILFGNRTLVGALVYAWQGAVDQRAERSPCQARIVLELRRLALMQTVTRQEKHSAERLVARQAAFSAASHLLPLHLCQRLGIGKAEDGRPLLQITKGNPVMTDRLSLSLSHCSGWAAAAVGR